MGPVFRAAAVAHVVEIAAAYGSGRPVLMLVAATGPLDRFICDAKPPARPAAQALAKRHSQLRSVSSGFFRFGSAPQKIYQVTVEMTLLRPSLLM
jgi:hypothetical protein